MKIHFLKQDCLEALKSNIPDNLHHYAEPDNKWIYKYFGDENPFSEFQFEVEDFKLNMNREVSENEDISTLDVEDAITLFTALKDLSPTQATDERFWAGLCHSDLWDYLHVRWFKNNRITSDINKSSQTIKSRYFFGQDPRRSIFTNTLSRLWWVAYLTYDKDRKDCFELTRYFSKFFVTKVTMIFSSNFTSSKNVCHGLIDAMIHLEKENYKYNGESRYYFQEALRYLNIFGGTHILDYYSSEEIKEKVLKHMHRIAQPKIKSATIAKEPETPKIMKCSTPTNQNTVIAVDTQKNTSDMAESDVVKYFRNMKIFRSYKLLLTLALMDNKGSVTTDQAIEYFADYYNNRTAKGKEAESGYCVYVSPNAPYKDKEGNLIRNPIKALCNSGFVVYDNINKICSFAPDVYENLSEEEKDEIYSICRDRLAIYYKEKSKV